MTTAKAPRSRFSRFRRLLAALAFILILLTVLFAFVLNKPRSTYWPGRKISIVTQSLKACHYPQVVESK
jgi:hypothetical protein